MKSRGFTLIELAIVLAVIAVLAAVLTPLVTSYIDQAREARAANDVRAIAQAVNMYRRDTAQYPVYADATDASNDTQTLTELVGSGTALAAANEWTFSSSGSLNEFLNTNKLNLATTSSGGRPAYRGPYLDLISADPWGNAYAVNAVNLYRSSSNSGFVISAGSDSALNTERDQTGQLTVGGDDIVARIK